MNEQRLIDANRLKEDIKNGSDIRLSILKDQYPTIEAVPVVRGKWVKITTESLEVECTCSLCAGDAPAEYGRYTWLKTNFCPHCGARMDGDSE